MVPAIRGLYARKFDALQGVPRYAMRVQSRFRVAFEAAGKRSGDMKWFVTCDAKVPDFRDKLKSRYYWTIDGKELAVPLRVWRLKRLFSRREPGTPTPQSLQSGDDATMTISTGLKMNSRTGESWIWQECDYRPIRWIWPTWRKWSLQVVLMFVTWNLQQITNGHWKQLLIAGTRNDWVDGTWLNVSVELIRR